MWEVTPAPFHIEKHAQCVILTGHFSVGVGPWYKTHAETTHRTAGENSQLSSINFIENMVRDILYYSPKIN